jgi:hypothetical protein
MLLLQEVLAWRRIHRCKLWTPYYAKLAHPAGGRASGRVQPERRRRRKTSFGFFAPSHACCTACLSTWQRMYVICGIVIYELGRA